MKHLGSPGAGLPQWRPKQTRKGQGRNHPSDPRNGNQIGEQTHQRDLLKQHHAQGSQTHAKSPLFLNQGPRIAAQSWFVWGRLCHEKHAYRHKAQPKASLHQSPRVDEQHHHHGQQPLGMQGPTQGLVMQHTEGSQHGNRSLRRNPPTAEDRIQSGK